MKALKEFLNESLASKDLKESVNGKCPDCWYGVEGARVVSHGEWADPEIEWDGELYNYWDVEEFVAAELGLEDLYSNDEDKFEKEMMNRPDEIRAALDEFASMNSGN